METFNSDKNASTSINIECECGTHMLKVENDIERYDGKKFQSFYLAMFGFGDQRYSLWKRLSISLRLIRTGKIYNDQLVLDPKEAKKLADFINENLEE